MKRLLLRVHPVVWVVLGIAIVITAVVAPGIHAENERARAREIRVCEMSKVMSGETDSLGAELLCARGWER